MAITVEARTNIVGLVVGMFGAAPGASVLSDLVAAYESGSTLPQIAANLANTDQFKGLYPTFLTSGELATKIVNQLLAEASTEAKAEAVAVLTAELNGGMSRVDAFIAAIDFVNGTDATDPNYGSSAAAFDNKVAVAVYYSVDSQKSGSSLEQLQGVVANVNSTAASVTTAKADIDGTFTVGQTFTLTTSATDVVSGTGNADTIIGQLGQSTTLQSSDTINGGSGLDTLRVVTDGAAAQSATGFTTDSVEVLEVQAQATGGSTLSLENVTGVTTIRSASSSGDLTLNQVKAIADLDVKGAINAKALTVNYQAAAVAGTADVQKLALNGNALGAVTVNGVETFALSTSTANSSVASIAGDKFAAVTVAGDKSVSITAALPNTVKSVDASAQTAGGISFTAGTADVAVKGGAGSDTATFTGTFTSADSFDGGAGRDTIIANQAEYTGSSYAAAAKISNVETIRIADKLTANFDASKIAGEDTYRLDSGFTGPVTISKADDASTLDVRAASTGTLTYSIGDTGSLATDTGTANTLNIAVGSTDGINAGTISASGVETLKLTSNGVNKVADATKTGVNTLTIVDAAATNLTVTGSEDLSLTLVGTALSTLDASASTGENDFTAVTYKAATAATITGGAGIDKITGSAAGDTINGGAGADVISGAGGADTITGGAGADTFKYSAATDSQGTSQDVITDFLSGTDKFDFAALATSVGRSAIVLKSGSAADFGSAQAAIAQTSGNTQAVYQADTNTLWVDLNDDGTLNNNDLSIKLTGVTSLTAADIGANASGNAITLSAAAATVNATTSTNADKVSTALNDTITSTIARLVGSTIDGLTGTDALILSDAGAVGALPATITNVETLQLASVGTTANTGVAFNDAGVFANVTGSSNADTIASTADLREGGKISLGAGADVITALALFETSAGADTSYKFDIDMGAGDDTVTQTTALTFTADSKLDGGEGSDTLALATGANISLGSVTSFENLTLTGGVAFTATSAQYNALTAGTVTAAGADSVTFSDTGAVTATAVAAIETYVAGAGGLNLSVGTAANALVFTGSAAVDTLNINSSVWTAADSFAGAGGADVMNVKVDGDNTIVLAATLTNVETLNLTGTATTAKTGINITAAAATTGLATIDASGLTNGGTFDMGSLATTAQAVNGKNGAADVVTSSTVAAGVTTTVSADHGDVFNNASLTGTSKTVIKAYAKTDGTTTITVNTGVDFDAGDLTLSVYKADGTQVSIAALASAVSGTVTAAATFAGGNTTYVIDMNADGLYGNGDITINIVGQDLTATDGLASGSITF